MSASIVRALESRRPDAKLAFALAATILALDLFWSLIEGSTGTLAYALIDEPAHLATCALALLAFAAVARTRLPGRFVASALIASVAIDADHVPGLLGSHLLTGGGPRPYSHSLAVLAALLAVACLTKRGTRQLLLGAAFGVGAHLLRDLATGPGVPLLWPASDGAIGLPYAGFVGALLLAAVLSHRASASRSTAGPSPSWPKLVVVLTVATFASAWLARARRPRSCASAPSSGGP